METDRIYFPKIGHQTWEILTATDVQLQDPVRNVFKVTMSSDLKGYYIHNGLHRIRETHNIESYVIVWFRFIKHNKFNISLYYYDRKEITYTKRGKVIKSDNHSSPGSVEIPVPGLVDSVNRCISGTDSDYLWMSVITSAPLVKSQPLVSLFLNHFIGSLVSLCSLILYY